ncbi:hypothetical protein GGR26_001638 [Lewinella marina]|uniref:Uncharacterized protein n=1 Tax=Neolewinella marina TaxID=438751 RepID=A0A2G0CAV7_9BACT|nr:hypothetical protein [Neolewinella marina]NJB85870.1 hypothetical protein [Neolewinella marina]PHK97108.1 hypothetical protein CGL56_17670 [Neolewinella marina]
MHHYLSFLLLLSLLLAGPRAMAQDDIFDESKAQTLNLGTATPDLVNFKFGRVINNVEGLKDGSYTTTIDGVSTLTTRGEHIGQVILYARLLAPNDTTIWMDAPEVRGSITITPIQANTRIESNKKTYRFSRSDAYKQIYHIIQEPDVDQVEIKFSTQDGYFLVQQVEIIPYSSTGLTIIRNRKRYQNELATKPIRHRQLNANYIEEFQRIEQYHQVLSNLINRNESTELANLKANSSNPFTSPEFVRYFEEVVAKADASTKPQLQGLRQDISKFKFQDVALTLDNLLLGGKFATLISLVGNVFEGIQSVQITPKQEMDIVRYENQYYMRSDKRNKIQFEPIDDPLVLEKIQQLNEKNRQYQDYLGHLQQYIGQDLDLQNKINQDISLAKKLREELEALEWQMLRRFTKKSPTDFIENNRINFTLATNEFNSNFPSADAIEIETIDALEQQLQLATNSILTVREDYQQVLASLKTHYETLYLLYPNQRIDAFQDLNLLDSNLKLNWNNNQREIIKRYNGSQLNALLDSALNSL